MQPGILSGAPADEGGEEEDERIELGLRGFASSAVLCKALQGLHQRGEDALRQQVFPLHWPQLRVRLRADESRDAPEHLARQ